MLCAHAELFQGQGIENLLQTSLDTIARQRELTLLSTSLWIDVCLPWSKEWVESAVPQLLDTKAHAQGYHSETGQYAFGNATRARATRRLSFRCRRREHVVDRTTIRADVLSFVSSFESFAFPRNSRQRSGRDHSRAPAQDSTTSVRSTSAFERTCARSARERQRSTVHARLHLRCIQFLDASHCRIDRYRFVRFVRSFVRSFEC